MTEQSRAIPRTRGASHSERRAAVGLGAAGVALLDQLDDLVAKRDHALGEQGNAAGRVRAAEQDLWAKNAALTGFEEQARRTRMSFEVLRGLQEREETP